MGRRKTPQQKKAESYAKDRVYYGLDRHSTSHAKQRRKHSAERAYRHRLAARLDPSWTSDEGTSLEDGLGIRRRKLYHWGPWRLREHLAESRHQRALRAAARLFRSSMDPALKKERFKRFLAQITSERSPESKRIAAQFRHALTPKQYSRTMPNGFEFGWWGNRERREWLAAFFADEPEWEARLRAWIAELLPDESAT